MPWQEFSPVPRDVKFEPERAVRLGAGIAAAPFFATFFAAASAGVAWWWMTSWTRRDAASPQSGPADVAVEAKSFASETPEAVAEAVMAHQPEPTAAPAPAEDRATQELEPAPAEVMEHAPVQARGVEGAVPAPIDLASVVDDLPAEAATTPQEAVEAAVTKLVAARQPSRRKAKSRA